MASPSDDRRFRWCPDSLIPADELPVAAFAVDRDLTFVMWNRRMAKLTGWSRDDVAQMGRFPGRLLRPAKGSVHEHASDVLRDAMLRPEPISQTMLLATRSQRDTECDAACDTERETECDARQQVLPRQEQALLRKVLPGEAATGQRLPEQSSPGREVCVQVHACMRTDAVGAANGVLHSRPCDLITSPGSDGGYGVKRVEREWAMQEEAGREGNRERPSVRVRVSPAAASQPGAVGHGAGGRQREGLPAIRVQRRRAADVLRPAGATAERCSSNGGERTFGGEGSAQREQGKGKGTGNFLLDRSNPLLTPVQLLSPLAHSPYPLLSPRWEPDALLLQSSAALSPTANVCPALTAGGDDDGDAAAAAAAGAGNAPIPSSHAPSSQTTSLPLSTSLCVRALVADGATGGGAGLGLVGALHNDLPQQLERCGFDVVTAGTVTEAVRRFQQSVCDLPPDETVQQRDGFEESNGSGGSKQQLKEASADESPLDQQPASGEGVQEGVGSSDKSMAVVAQEAGVKPEAPFSLVVMELEAMAHDGFACIRSIRDAEGRRHAGKQLKSVLRKLGVRGKYVLVPNSLPRAMSGAVHNPLNLSR
ncbi:unnamed protein product [Closterium sp. NIES-64]|nr:unnamed protein product [Closterium sp. NIES-64]